MATIFAGTAYNQVIEVHSSDKKKTKFVYGALSNQPVQYISSHPFNNLTVYATHKTVTAIMEQDTKEIVNLNNPDKIISLQLDGVTSKCEYLLNNGSLYSSCCIIHSEQTIFDQIYKGQKHNLYTGATHSSDNQNCLVFGKGVVPMIINKQNCIVSWRGKNVKHDELDLEVPIKDVAASFIRQNKFLSILNQQNKLRIYDIRGTHRRPVNDILLKTTHNSNLTKMAIDINQIIYYVANESGEVFQLDSRKDWGITGKFKGINTTITGLSINHQLLITTSLDCFTRIFDINDRKLLQKIYLNKPIRSLEVKYDHRDPLVEQEEQVGQIQEMDLSQQEEKEQKKAQKIKQIRKRNKVGLKYLRPQEFDSPQEIPVKEQHSINRKWLEELNEVDRREFQQQLE